MNNIWKYIYIGVLVSFFGFWFLGIKSNANALPSLDTQSWTVLEGGNGAYTGIYDFGVSPENAVYGIDQIIQSLNDKLYDTYGWDLETASWIAEDYFNSGQWVGTGADNFINELSDGTYTTAAQALANNMQLYALTGQATADSLFNGAKTWILGQYDSTTNTIKNVINKTLVMLSANLLDNLGLVGQSLEQDQTIKNYSSLKMMYGTNMTFVYNSTSTNITTFTSQSPLYYFLADGASSNSSGQNPIWCAVPKSICTYNGSLYLLPDNFFNGTVMRNGQTYSFTNAYVWEGSYIQNTITINGQEYIYGAFLPRFSGSYYNVYSSNLFIEKTPFLNYWNGQTGTENTYSYDKSSTDTSGNTINWQSVRDRLEGKIVPSDKIQELNDLIKEIPVKPVYYPNPSPNGVPEYIPELQPTPEQWGLISDKIDEIIGISEQIEEWIENTPLTEPEPTPEPEPEPEPSPSSPYVGVTVPDDFPVTPIFEPFSDVINAPFDLFSIFRPIFALFGVNWLMPLWLLIPPIFIIILIIRALL